MATKFIKREVYMIAGMMKNTIENEIEHPIGEDFKRFGIVIVREEFSTSVSFSRKDSYDQDIIYDNMIKEGTMFMKLSFKLTPGLFNYNSSKVLASNFSLYDEKLRAYLTIPFDIKRKDIHSLVYNFFERFGYIETGDEKEKI